MQIARPPATPEVADPGAGRSSTEMQGTYLRLGLNFFGVKGGGGLRLLGTDKGGGSGNKGGQDSKLHFKIIYVTSKNNPVM